jgi:hypothetical protein
MEEQFDYYVRTVGGSYQDSRHEFTTEWQGVTAGTLNSSHFADPKLEIVTAEEYAGRPPEPEKRRKRSRRKAAKAQAAAPPDDEPPAEAELEKVEEPPTEEPEPPAPD